MQLLSEKLNFAPDAAALPEGFSQKIFDVSRHISCPSQAKQVFEQLEPILAQYRADRHLAIACGVLTEKQRDHQNMRPLWRDLQKRFPNDQTALRMMMRWYRRDGKTDAGIASMNKLYPNSWHSLSQAHKAILGFSELKAWDEIDRIMSTILVFHSHDRAIRMAYIKALNEQSRFVDAADVAIHVCDRDRMGQASRSLLDAVEQNAHTLCKYNRADAADIIEDIFECADAPRALTSVERVVFFTGQLGTGGAERQLSRIACAFQKRWEDAEGDNPKPEVWVKHATPETGADFYRPLLQENGVTTRVLAEQSEIDCADLNDASDDLKELIQLLAPDVRRHTCQLLSMFKDNKTDVAYLWQDGGIVQSAIAAVLAGVPRIVTSFRGLPPNLRPNFFRNELPVLYAALASLDHVTLTANSAKTAAAYEEWLSLDAGTIVVIPNAIPAVLADGDDSDQAFWSETVSASEDCTKTVLGVFRFDANKRPLQWIEAAARYLETNRDTRFVMLGNGALYPECEALITQLGLSDRVFLAGIRSNVGFYMHRADVVMHLAQMEGLPNVLIEAQLAGTPVLATPAGGTDEVVCPGVTSILLSDAQELPEQELDEKLALILSDENELARMGAAALAHSGERFSVDTILDKTTELFKHTGKANT